MKSKTGILLIVSFFSVFIFSGCKKNDPEEVVTVVRDISYGPHERNKLDLYLCASYDENTPAIIIIHGGGWVMGDKTGAAAFADGFAREGILAVSINYRYPNPSSGIDYTEVLDDIGAATGELQRLAVAYHFRKSGYTLFGHSSGGHLSLLYAYRNNTSNCFQQVVAYDPVTDLTDPFFASSPGMTGLFLTLSGDSALDARRDASPLFHADSTAIATLCFHGTLDDVFPWEQSSRLIQHLDSLHIRSKLILLQNSPHISSGDFSRVISETLSFVSSSD